MTASWGRSTASCAFLGASVRFLLVFFWDLAVAAGVLSRETQMTSPGLTTFVASRITTAVTDPASSGLVASNDAPGGNVSGTSDMNPVKEQANLLVQLVPEAKTVGIMYHSSEDNSVLQAEMAQEALEALGLTVEIFTCADGTEVQAVAQSAASQVDALYIPTDNLMADTIATISMVCTPAGVPIICGESNMVDGGGTATYGIDYYRLGEQTAAQAIRILSEGADISTMPIEYYSAELELVVNEDVMAQLGLTVPESLQ